MIVQILLVMAFTCHVGLNNFLKGLASGRTKGLCPQHCQQLYIVDNVIKFISTMSTKHMTKQSSSTRGMWNNLSYVDHY